MQACFPISLAGIAEIHGEILPIPQNIYQGKGQLLR